MLSNEMCEVSEMSLLLQDLTTEFCLGHFSIEMRRYSAIERPEPNVRAASGYDNTKTYNISSSSSLELL